MVTCICLCTISVARNMRCMEQTSNWMESLKHTISRLLPPAPCGYGIGGAGPIWYQDIPSPLGQPSSHPVRELDRRGHRIALAQHTAGSSRARGPAHCSVCVFLDHLMFKTVTMFVRVRSYFWLFEYCAPELIFPIALWVFKCVIFFFFGIGWSFLDKL